MSLVEYDNRVSDKRGKQGVELNYERCVHMWGRAGRVVVRAHLRLSVR